MLRKAATAFGVVFILIGILGFVPGITQDNELLGIFRVDAIHNLVHILSGVAALIASSRSDWSRLYFQVFAVVYGLVTLWGLFDHNVLGFIHVDSEDNVLHLVITLATAYLGYFYRDPAGRDASNDAVVTE